MTPGVFVMLYFDAALTIDELVHMIRRKPFQCDFAVPILKRPTDHGMKILLALALS